MAWAENFKWFELWEVPNHWQKRKQTSNHPIHLIIIGWEVSPPKKQVYVYIYILYIYIYYILYINVIFLLSTLNHPVSGLYHPERIDSATPIRLGENHGPKIPSTIHPALEARGQGWPVTYPPPSHTWTMPGLRVNTWGSFFGCLENHAVSNKTDWREICLWGHQRWCWITVYRIYVYSNYIYQYLFQDT